MTDRQPAKTRRDCSRCAAVARRSRLPVGVCPCRWSAGLISRCAEELLNADVPFARHLNRLLELMPDA